VCMHRKRFEVVGRHF